MVRKCSCKRAAPVVRSVVKKLDRARLVRTTDEFLCEVCGGMFFLTVKVEKRAEVKI